MTPEQILDSTANILTQAQRETFFEQGFLVVEGFIADTWLARLRDVMSELAERGKRPHETPVDFEYESVAGSGERLLRQVRSSVDFHPALWEYASTAPTVDLVADAVGPNVKFWQSNVAFKLPGGRGFPWHQDFAFIGASNLSPMMTFTFLEEVTPELGPTKVIPGSHLDVPYDHYDEDGNWLGVIAPHELSRVAAENAVEICAPAGSILMAKCAVVHMAERNRGSQARPVVINGYMSADTYCYVESPYQSHYNWRIVRGETPTIVDGDGPYTKLPPDWVTYEGVRIDNMEHAY